MKERAGLRRQRGPLWAVGLVVALTCFGSPSLTQAAEPAGSTPPSASPAKAAPPADPGEVFARELVEALVERGVLNRKEADALVARARAKMEAEAASRTEAPPAPDAPGTVRVVHLTESEKQRIRDEIRKEVLAQASAEGWAQPGTVPEWLKRIDLNGDVRVRYELDAFDSNNAPFINFQAINSGPPYDTNVGVTNFNPPPYLNTTEDRRQLRLRTRLGLAAAVSEDVRAEIRLATGSTTNPVSTNQTLGADSSNKVTFLLDQASLIYRPGGGLRVDAGRVANPYTSTELVWDGDVNLDGLATRLDYGGGFVTAGAFAIGATPFDFPSNRPEKVGSRDKWLFGAQLGTHWKLGDRGSVTLASSYYDFHQVQGELSKCGATSASIPCDSDPSRPGFIQKGNTLFALRDVQGDPSQPQFQYFGLASPFRVLNATARVDMGIGAERHLVVEADAVANLAYDFAEVRNRRPVNNFGEQKCDSTGQNCDPPVAPYEGGSKAFLLQVLFGEPKPVHANAWNFTTGYRRIESDAVLDAFTDSDFHLGGTNAKGFTLGGAWAFSEAAWLSLRWLSTTEVSGPPLASDVYQFDINARF